MVVDADCFLTVGWVKKCAVQPGTSQLFYVVEFYEHLWYFGDPLTSDIMNVEFIIMSTQSTFQL